MQCRSAPFRVSPESYSERKKYSRETFDGEGRSQKLAKVASIKMTKLRQFNPCDGAVPKFDLRDRRPPHSHFTGGFILRQSTSLPGLFQTILQLLLIYGHVMTQFDLPPLLVHGGDYGPVQIEMVGEESILPFALLVPRHHIVPDGANRWTKWRLSKRVPEGGASQ